MIKRSALVVLVLLAVLVFGFQNIAKASDVRNVHMSDTPDGPLRTDFTLGTSIVYVVFDHLSLQKEPVRVRVAAASGNVIFDGSRTFDGTGTSTFPVQILDPAGFLPGPYITTVYLNPYTSISLDWTLGGVTTIPTPTPLPAAVMALTPSSLAFTISEGAEAPPEKNVIIYNNGAGVIRWEATSSASWLKLRSSRGATPSLLRVAVETTGLPGGIYLGNITIRALDAGVTNTPQTVPVRLEITSTAGRQSISLHARNQDVGWFESNDGPGNHLDSDIMQAGYLEGKVYHGVVLFGLSLLPSQATIHAAALELRGADGSYLGEVGAWHAGLLPVTLDTGWRSLTYDQIHTAPISATVGSSLGTADLKAGQVNLLPFDGAAIAGLQQRLTAGKISFRVDGPVAGDNSLFIWDTGISIEGLRAWPVLRVSYTTSP
ncbi:MAG: hypothetical protein EXR62_04245 [Chloroflexi bacterium]|nr:hypothetical protein [Chloroflexota bacterium]